MCNVTDVTDFIRQGCHPFFSLFLYPPPNRNDGKSIIGYIKKTQVVPETPGKLPG